MKCFNCENDIHTEPIDEYKDDKGHVLCVYCYYDEDGSVVISKLKKEKEELLSFILDCYYSKDFQDKMDKQLIKKNDELKLKYKGMGL
jgi:hypothetical protein